MSVDALLAISVVVFILAFLVTTRIAPEFIMLGGLTVLLALNVVSPSEGLAGFSNQGVLTIAALFVAVAALRETGAINWIALHFLGKPTTEARALLKLAIPTAIMSAFVNNTPLITVMVPLLRDWARKEQISIARLLMPVNFAAILGGMCTLVGTSTNLVVNGLLISTTNHAGLGMFDISWVGLPCAIAGIAYLILFSKWLLPERKSAITQMRNPREYIVEMMVSEGSPLIGKTIEEAGTEAPYRDVPHRD